MHYDVDLFVIGAGSGGVRCARVAAQHGARVAIAENRHWGGTCVNLGCVPKKLMVQASEYAAALEGSQGFGWDVPAGVSHDWARFTAARNKEISRLNTVYVDLLKKSGVRLIEGTASFIDSHTLRIDPGMLNPSAHSYQVTAKHIVIATGSAPTRLEIEGADMALVSDDIFFLSERPRSLCVIGAGYIGVEFSSIFAGFGTMVDMVYRQDRPLRGFDPDLRRALQESFAARGIKQHPGSRPAKITKNQHGGLEVTLDNGRIIEAEAVLMATGRHPNVQSLALDNAGVQVTSSGRIKTGGHHETTQKGIFAIGDVTNRQNLTPVAIAEGHSLADYLYAGHERPCAFDVTPKAVFVSPPLASVGVTEEEITDPADIYISQFRPLRHTLTGRDEKTFMKVIVDRKSQRVIGMHLMGEDAPEIIQGFAVAIAAGLTKQDFDQTIGLHPTSAEELVTMRNPAREAAPG